MASGSLMPHLQVLVLHVRGVELVQHVLLDGPPDRRRVVAQLLREHARRALPARGQLAVYRAQHRLGVVRGHCARSWLGLGYRTRGQLAVHRPQHRLGMVRGHCARGHEYRVRVQGV